MKLRRRLAHVASMTTPPLLCALLVASAASAQERSVVKQPNKHNQTVTDKDYSAELKSITEELRAIHEEQAKAEATRAAQKPTKGPPIWSNWVLAIVAALAGWTAYRTFNHERDAVRVTERADVLFVTLKLFDPRANKRSEDVHPWSQLIVVQRNFGRTTATDVRVRWRFFIDGDPIPETPFIPPAVIGAGAELETKIPPNIETLTGGRFNQVARSEVVFRGIGEVIYTDVFGKEHHATFRGVFRQGDAGAGAFAVESEERD